MPAFRPLSLAREPEALASGVLQRLANQRHRVELAPLSAQRIARSSAVLFLLSPNGRVGGGPDGSEVHLILNKRSAAVRQAGDLCCPGGGITPATDRLIAALLRLPRSPLTAWPQWSWWRRRRPHQARRLALLLGTAMRESFEEMRLNPLGVRFLGPLPVERLVVFQKEIYPFVGWVGRQRRFIPNWEVADLVYIPLRALLDPRNYARLHYRFNTAEARTRGGIVGDMPCYIHRRRANPGSGSEVLWGATFRLTMVFLRMVFGFRPPHMAHLPEVKRDFDDAYVNGSR